METTYKEVRIIYDESVDAFVAQVRGQNRSYPNLKAAKKAIDYAVRKKFQRVPCWVQRGWSYQDRDYEKGTITSINAQGEVWITFDKDQREKFHEYRSKAIVADTAENRDAINRIRTLRRSAAEIQEKIRSLEESLEPALKGEDDESDREDL